MDDHAAIWDFESRACQPTNGETWLEEVERLVGHDIDGDLAEDGYSLDTFSDMCDAGLTPEQAAVRIVKSVFVAPDGTVYRFEYGRRDRMTDVYSEKFAILTLDGAMSVRYQLPEGSRLVWSPDRDVTAAP